MDTERIVQLLANGFTAVTIDFASKERWYLDSIPSEPGWYVIETDAPVNILENIGRPKRSGNYNIPQRIEKAKYLSRVGLVPQQTGSNLYPVYSGEAANLLNRAREHSFGGNGTGCLAINEYPRLKSYRWCFSFLSCAAFDPECGGDKNLRNYVEQIWRSENGWPVLCSR